MLTHHDILSMRPGDLLESLTGKDLRVGAVLWRGSTPGRNSYVVIVADGARTCVYSGDSFTRTAARTPHVYDLACVLAAWGV